ncbi:hypothetical protein [Caproicibacterium amylolyticum]|uniref:Uncharacterized protein n=1 Tax=Caproicibacterium amylolyticum TaxID=2766537 RepID=A0A7G9WJF5_9FIRM|nr:hypothetical protein [Caproicibacterium amylolyticum]QNO18817.1 hypothetical protein H6X83_04055 [Caproicibacterium amylolyticum]
MYATFDFYSSAYLGTLISVTDWPRYERDASLYIDRLTYERLITDPLKVTDRVKSAVCAVAEALKRQDDAESKSSEREGVKSFSNDGYSESYGSITTIRKSYDKLKVDAANLWLPTSDPLRYAGCDL